MPTQSRDEADWKPVMAMLMRDVEEYPADILYEAVIQIRRTQHWMPGAAEIRRVADILVQSRRADIRRIDALIPPAPDDPVKPPLAERKKQVAALLEAFRSGKSIAGATGEPRPYSECP